MDFMRRLQAESPILFLVVLFVGIFIAFQLLLFVAELILGPFGLPGVGAAGPRAGRAGSSWPAGSRTRGKSALPSGDTHRGSTSID